MAATATLKTRDYLVHAIGRNPPPGVVHASGLLLFHSLNLSQDPKPHKVIYEKDRGIVDVNETYFGKQVPCLAGTLSQWQKAE